MCASVAGQWGKRVMVIDHAEEPGKKILISGGGRCNFTNLDVHPSRFISNNPHFAVSALTRYTQHDFIELVNLHGIAWHEKTLGQLFCDGNAKQIVNLLLDECAKSDVTINLSETIDAVRRNDGGFTVETCKGTYRTKALVVATGAPSIPKLGATGFAYDLARQFKLKIIEPRPALVPLKLGKEDALFSELSGVATDTIARNDKATFREASLFTHKGLSGPAMLQISSYWRHGETIKMDFMPDLAIDWLVAAKHDLPRSALKTALATQLPERLAETLASKLDVSAKKLADFKDAELQRFAEKLSSWTFAPNGTEGFAKAEVTVGGVSTNELSSKTMEAKKVPGLYFVGECVDVTGWLGGYNFQWAWSSGWAAGSA